MKLRGAEWFSEPWLASMEAAFARRATAARQGEAWWGKKDSNLRSHKTADLQLQPFKKSAPFKLGKGKLYVFNFRSNNNALDIFWTFRHLPLTSL